MPRAALAVAASLVLACGAPASEPSDPPARPRGAPAEDQPTDVAQRVADRIRELAPERRVERRDARHVSVDDAELDVANLAEECRRSPDVCDAAIDRWARASVAPEATPTREAIRAVLLPIEAATAARDEAAGAGDERLVGRPFVGPLYESFVIDEPDRIVHLSAEHRTALGNPSLDDLHALALENMRRAFAAELVHQPFDEERAPRVRVVSIGDSYENARILLHERWAAVARTVDGDLLAAAPARDVVIFTGSASARDVATLRWLAQQMTRNEPHPIHPAILRWTPERWELFHANDAEDPAIAEALRAPP